MKLSGEPVETGLSANVPNLKSIQNTLFSVHLKEKSWQTQPEKKKVRIHLKCCLFSGSPII